MLHAWAEFNGKEIPSELELSVEESHHLVGVRRVREGDRVEVLAGHGVVLQCKVGSVRKKRVHLQVLEHRDHPPRQPQITLGQAVLKGKAMDWLVQKATELGVARIQPLWTDHSEVRLDPDRAKERVRRWRQIALESCKQCGNPWLPEIRDPLPVEQWWEESASSPTPQPRLIAALAADARPLHAVVRDWAQPPGRLCYSIGPEGDFSQREYQVAKQTGWQSIHLGPLVLRAETAAIAVLAYSLLSTENHPA